MRHDFRTFGISEIEIIGGGHGQRTGCREVPTALGDPEFRAFAGVKVAVAAIAIERHGNRLSGFFDTDHCRVRTRSHQRVGAYGVVVLFPDPAFGTQIRGSDQTEQVRAQVARFRNRGGWIQRSPPVRLHIVRPVVFWRFISQRAVGDGGFQTALMPNAHDAVSGHFADCRGIQTPLTEDPVHFFLASFLCHQQHALLGFREQHLIGRHARFALRHLIQVDLDAHAAPASHLTGGRGESRRAHVLNGNDGACLHGLNAGFQQEFFEEGVAHLNVGAFLFRLFREFSRRHGGAVDAVATGFSSHVNHRVAHAGSARVEHLVFPADAQCKHVDQRIGRVAFFENTFAANSGNAETVAVVGNPPDHAIHNTRVVSGLRNTGEGSESERIHNGDGARAHGENIAQNAAHAGGRALEGFNVAGVVVGFNLERDYPAAANADDSRVLARSLNHILTFGGEFAQVKSRAFVRAMLAPHHAEHAQLGIGWLASQQRDDFLVLVRRQLMLRDELRGNVHRARAGTARSIDRKIPRPSVDPISGSQARSG